MKLKKILTNEAQEELNLLNRYLLEKKDHQFQVSKEIEIKDVQLKSMLSELSKVSEDSTQQSTILEQFRKQLANISKEKEEKIKKFESIKQVEDTIKQQLENIREKSSNAEENLIQINRRLDSKQNEFNLTKSLVDNLEGFSEAIKFLRKNARWKNAPLLSDIISCPEEYRVTIENYLEPFINYCVVDTQDDALKAITLLGEAAMGKAHFFVLEKLESFKKNDTYAPPQGLPVLELIDFDSKYETLIHHLLGNAFIAEVPEKTSGEDQYTVLDREGKVIHRQFSISGGSIGLFEGKRISRAKNLEKLDKEIKELNKSQDSLEKIIEELNNKIAELKQSSKFEQLEEIKNELARINERYISVEAKQEQFTELLSSNKNKRKEIRKQIVDLEKVLERLKPQAEKGKSELLKLESDFQSKQEEVTRFRKNLEVKSSVFNEQTIIFHQCENNLSSIFREISLKEESYGDAIHQIEKNKEELEDADSSLHKLVKKSIESDDKLVGMYEQKESLEFDVNEAEKKYYEVQYLIDKEEKNQKEIQRQYEKTGHTLMEYQNRLNDIKIGLTSIKDRLFVEFNIDFEKIKEEEIADYKKIPEEKLKIKIEELKNKIDNMGSINPMALEAFEEIQQRHTFITGQKEDLIKAKESLLTTMSEIDEVAKETFMKAFQRIKDNFINVFRTLFTEKDDCDLILTNPKQPLESSIDIIAKPKGKRPLTIDQLSGGEKTLTATSLLFSIYLLKPAPFCIFDEVDAPLDDANIDKFNEIIRKFSKESQFIIVTHNKRTMTSTDIIYGVTMQEQGVSKVIPVDLRDLA